MRLFKQKKAPDSNGRRRPITGSQGKLSFSYYASQRSADDYHTERHGVVKKPHERLRYFARQTGIAMLGLVLLACVISLLEVDSRARVVIVNGNEGYALHSAAEYETAASQALHSSLANSNKITIQTQSVSAKLKRQFPEIDDASIVLPLVGHRPVVYIQLTKPVAILGAGNQSVVLDSSGNALAATNQLSNLAAFHLPTVDDQTDSKLAVGQKALPEGNVQFLQLLFDQLEAQHIQVGKLVLPAGTEELDAQIAGQPYFVKFNLHDGSAAQQVGTFLAVRQHLAGEGKVPGKYIDVRIPGRAYYL